MVEHFVMTVIVKQKLTETGKSMFRLFNRNFEQDIRTGANIVSNILLELKDLTKPGVNLSMLDELTARRIKEAGATSANFGYKPDWAPTPFPSTLCTSVDFEICHGIPNNRELKEGSVVTYDLGIKYKSAFSDAALTVAVGKIDNRKDRATRYGLQALYEGIKVVRAGVPISAIGKAIESYVEPRGYNIIKEYSGHHIGKIAMHEDPQISHKYYKENDNKFLEEGRIICIEPMISPGNGNIAIAKDGWTAYCKDGQPVVMFEHMILVGKDGGEILTKHL